MRNAVKNFFFFLLCSLLVLSVSASPIPAGINPPVSGFTARLRMSEGNRSSDPGLEHRRERTGAHVAYSLPASGNIPYQAGHAAHLSETDGFRALSTAGTSGFCEPASCSAAPSLQAFSAAYPSSFMGGSIATAAATRTAPEPPSLILLFTGTLLIGAVLAMRRQPVAQVAVSR